MAALLALVATILTSFLPILNKRLLQDARPALVAWVVWERLCWWCSSPQGYSAHLGQRSQLPSEEPGSGCVPIHVLFSPPSRLPGVAPLSGFSAIALGLVGYVTTLF